MLRAMRTILLILALSACGQKKVNRRRPKSFSGPVEIAWTNEYQFQVKDEPAARGHVMLDKNFLKVFVENFPQGTTLELGSQSGIVGEWGSGSVELDVRDKLGALPVELAEAKLDPGVPLVLKPINQPAVTLKLRPQGVSFHIDDMLKKA